MRDVLMLCDFGCGSAPGCLSVASSVFDLVSRVLSGRTTNSRAGLGGYELMSALKWF